MEALGIDTAFWRDRRVLITGHTGFKGTWLALWLTRLGARVTGVALPAEPASLNARIGGCPDIASHEADIRDAEPVARIVDTCSPEVVFHLAAQALVRRGYHAPIETLSTNVMGTAHLLEALRLNANRLRAVVVVTSDKCYRNLDTGEAYREDDPLGGKDPYSASKACQEIVTHAYRQSFGSGRPAIVTARAGNVIGGGDYAADRLVPDILRAKAEGRRLVLRSPNATRPWQHILDPLCGYLMFAERAARESVPPTLNFAPPATSVVPVRTVVEAFNRAWGNGDSGWDQAADVDFAEARTLNLDASLARRTIGWRARLDIADATGWTAAWHRAVDAGANPRAMILEQIERYSRLPALD